MITTKATTVTTPTTTVSEETTSSRTTTLEMSTTQGKQAAHVIFLSLTGPIPLAVLFTTFV